jgi:hypothetical protein
MVDPEPDTHVHLTKQYKHYTVRCIINMSELSSHIPPLIAIAGYVAYPKQLRINPSLLYILSILHNGALVAFSAWTFLSLAQIIYNDGFVIQSNYYFQNPHFDKVIYWFYLSKYYEFIDTFLLYLNGKTPIFLQKYHHIGAVICWHLTYVYKVDSVWIPSIANSFVHTIMYSYYLCCLLKINQVRIIKKYITTLQLVQLFSTMLLANVLYQQNETNRNVLIMWVVNIYNIGLIVCFIKFYNQNYNRK